MGQLIIDLVHGSGHLGAQGLALAAAAFFVVSLTFLPRTPACVVAGVVYGMAAFPVVLLASTLGALAGFLLSRRLFRARFRAAMERRPRWRRVVEAIDAQGWTLVALLRFASPVPASATTYLAGLTTLKAAPYTLATLLGLMPQTFLFVLMGALGPAALGGSPSAIKLALMIMGALITVLIFWQTARRVRASLSRQLEWVA